MEICQKVGYSTGSFTINLQNVWRKFAGTGSLREIYREFTGFYLNRKFESSSIPNRI